MKRLMEVKVERKKCDVEFKEIVCFVVRIIFFDVLVKDWLNDNEIILEVRIYLLENFMLILILGVEKFLNEVEKRGLVDLEGFCLNFNFIDYLV